VNGQVFFLIAGVFVHVLSTNYQFESWEEAGATAICMLVLSEIDDVLWATAICMRLEIDDVLSSVSAHKTPLWRGKEMNDHNHALSSFSLTLDLEV
jgi:hypothetical protein